MDRPSLFRILELPSSATVRQVQRAYRRAALACHPDHHPDDDSARTRFVALSKAYRAWVRTVPARRRGARVGYCSACGAYDALYRQMDGRWVCSTCRLGSLYRKLLPLPAVIVVAKCASTIALLGLGIVLLLAALTRQSPSLAAWAGAAGLASLAVLAVTCLRIRYCVDRRVRIADSRRGKTQVKTVPHRR